MLIDEYPHTGFSGQVNFTRVGERKNNMYDHTLLIEAVTAGGERDQLMRRFYIGEERNSVVIFSFLFSFVLMLQSSHVSAVSI